MPSARRILSSLPLLALAACAAAANGPSTSVDPGSGTTTGLGGTGQGGATTGGSHAGGAQAGGGGAGQGGAGQGGGVGGVGGGGGTGGGGGQVVSCNTADECPGSDDECSKRACVAGHCGVEYAPQGTGLVMQGVGDCQKLVCDGAGATTSIVDDSDVPDDSNACTKDQCDNGVASNGVEPLGFACGQGLECDGQGVCAGCITSQDCPGKDDECRTRACTSGACGWAFAQKGTPLQAQQQGDCASVQCDGAGSSGPVQDDNDVPVDGKACTSDKCSGGAPSNPPVGPGGPCDQNGGTLCDGKGACVQCLTAATCPGLDGECQSRTCNGGVCGVAYQPKGTPLKGQVPGDCASVKCDGAGSSGSVQDDSDVPIDGNECTQDLCSNGAPSNPPSAVEAACSQNNGHVCDGKGACVECASNADCASQVCAKGVCAAATCNDGLQNGEETAIDCGGSCAPCPTVLVLAGGSASMFGAEYHPGGGWGVTPLAGVTVDGVALGALANGQGGGLMRFTKQGDPQDNLLQYTFFTPATVKTPSSWSAFTAVGPAVTTRGAPSLDVTASAVHAVFLGMDYKYYYAGWAGVWAPPAETVGTGAAQSYGPSPAAVAALGGGGAAIAFHDGADNNATTSRDRVNGAWQGSAKVASGAAFGLGPVMVALSSGPELVMAWARADNQLIAATRSGGVWSAPMTITNASTMDRPALAALPNGAAVLAFRGTDGKLYTSNFVGGVFSNPAGIASPNVSIVGVPAVAHGTGGATIELGYVGNDGKGYHARYVGNAWQAVTAIGGANLVSIAIASVP